MHKYFLLLPGLTDDVTHRIRNPRGHREREVAASKTKSKGSRLVLIFLFYFKIVVCAVIKDDAGFPVDHLAAVFVDTPLYVIEMLMDHRKGAENLMVFKLRMLKKLFAEFCDPEF